MNIEEQLKKELAQLDNIKTSFCLIVKEWQLEEQADNDPETLAALQTVARKRLGRLHDTLVQHKENVAHSLLDERKEEFKKIFLGFTEILNTYKDYENEEGRKAVITTLRLVEEGSGGFRQSAVTETYYENLLLEERERYRKENLLRLEKIYQQDFADGAYDCPDENKRKIQMVSDCRKQFHATRFGKEYHDQGRDKRLIAAYIISQKEQEYKDIYDFFGRWLALEIAEEHCLERHEQVYTNYIFKDNVDIDKVMDTLMKYVKDKTLKNQKHWFVVYRVFEKKQWLKSKLSQRAFRDQMNAAFDKALKCTKEDFSKVDSYFKKNEDYTEWSLEDKTAPQCCEEYKRLALLLDDEFKDSAYAKPGTIINTRKIEKFR